MADINIRRKLSSLVLIAGLALFATIVVAQKQLPPQSLAKSAVDEAAVFDGNRMRIDFENNGMLTSHRPSGHSGMEWPIYSGKYIDFTSGIWIGGKINGDTRVTASYYAGDYSPGPWGADPTDPRHRIYKINRRDLDRPSLYPDVVEWPTDLGAPWIDANDDGVYDIHDGDLPDLRGDQMLWYVANDGDVERHSAFETAPLGVEVRVTIWGYDVSSPLGDARYIKIQIFKKSGTAVKEAYIGLFDDPDLGNAGDDFVGSDSLLGLSYVYNDGSDTQYGDAPPAMGFALIRGPAVSASGETARAFGAELSDSKNLPLYAARNFYKHYIQDLGGGTSDALEAYYYLQGLYKDGSSMINPETGQPTRFRHPGDPAQNSGRGDGIWVDSDDLPSSDRRLLFSTGPFNLAEGDSQEVIWVQAIGQGSDPFNSIAVLMQNISELVKLENAWSHPILRNPVIPSLAAFDRQLVLTWKGIAQSIETFQIQWPNSFDGGRGTINLTFQGYNVYQYASADEEEPTLIATFDIVDGITSIKDSLFVHSRGEKVFATIQRGYDSGLQRHLVINTDAINRGLPLINGREYYYGITAYFHAPEGDYRETPHRPVTVRPQIAYNQEELHPVGSHLAVSRSGPTSGGSVEVMIIRPNVLTEANYTVSFDADGNWTLNDGFDDRLTAQTDVDGGYDSPLIDGLLVMVTQPAGGPFTTGDSFTFATSLPKSTDPDIDNITVWPNPYFAHNPEEVNDYQRWVTFDRLPPTATIRIFDIAGNTVRVLKHVNGTQQEIWNLRNHSNRDVASGIYIAVIESEYGNIILKLGVIQPQMRLSVY